MTDPTKIPGYSAAAREAARAEREQFYRAAGLWAERAGLALVIMAVLVGAGVALGASARVFCVVPWPARVMMLWFMGAGAVFGWVLFHLLPWVFRLLVGRAPRDPRPGGTP